MCKTPERPDPRATCSRSPIQAAIGGKVIARETIAADAQGRDRQVFYGGDISPQERSCWNKQKKGKDADAGVWEM